MNTNLVGAPRERMTLYDTVIPLLVVPEPAEECRCVLPVRTDPIKSQLGRDTENGLGAGDVFCRELACHSSDVLLADCACAQLVHHVVCSLWGFGTEHEPTGQTVEAITCYRAALLVQKSSRMVGMEMQTYVEVRLRSAHAS